MSRRPLPIRVLRWVGRHERSTLGGLGIVSAAVWAFIQLADEVLDGDTITFDEKILTALRTPGDLTDPLGPGWFEEFARDVTALGSVGVLTFVVLAVMGYLALRRNRLRALQVGLITGSGMVASQLLKSVFDRPRPDLVPHESVVYSSSFPSGHSMMSAVVFLTLAALLARVQPRTRLKAYLIVLGLILAVAIGASRVYLGVHWPTDVLAGWSAGAAWAVGAWLWLRRLDTAPEAGG